MKEVRGFHNNRVINFHLANYCSIINKYNLIIFIYIRFDSYFFSSFLLCFLIHDSIEQCILSRMKVLILNKYNKRNLMHFELSGNMFKLDYRANNFKLV